MLYLFCDRNTHSLSESATYFNKKKCWKTIEKKCFRRLCDLNEKCCVCKSAVYILNFQVSKWKWLRNQTESWISKRNVNCWEKWSKVFSARSVKLCLDLSTSLGYAFNALIIQKFFANCAWTNVTVSVNRAKMLILRQILRHHQSLKSF